jgi:CDP-6-deoxy-D-xylo-4-hexulose-3-dehydrase
VNASYYTAQAAELIDKWLRDADRHNTSAPKRYWYPLSVPTYGREEIVEALHSMCTFQTSMSEKTRQFEREFAAYLGCADAVMVNSGSSADLLLCFMLTDHLRPRLKPGDEILAPVVTWPTQLWSALMAGLKIRIVDAEPATMNIDVDDLEAKIGPNTRAIFLAHLMGAPCNMDRILDIARKHNLLIIEDCCEALGAEWSGKKVGTFGCGGSFSFFFSHHITTMEGGMIACPDDETADQLRILRAHGWTRNIRNVAQYELPPDIDPRYAFVNWGFNVRPTEVQAAFGLHQLRKLEHFNKARNGVAERFFGFLDQSPFLSRPRFHPQAAPAWFCLPVIVARDAPFTREDLTRYLENQGVETRSIVAGNLARQPAAKLLGSFTAGAFPGADVIHDRGFYMGLPPAEDDTQIDRLIRLLDQFLQAANRRTRVMIPAASTQRKAG